jgi:hypothetical protein
MCYERRRAEACVDESAHHALGTREEPGTLIQGAPVFPGSSRLGKLGNNTYYTVEVVRESAPGFLQGAWNINLRRT